MIENIPRQSYTEYERTGPRKVWIFNETLYSCNFTFRQGPTAAGETQALELAEKRRFWRTSTTRNSYDWTRAGKLLWKKP